MRVEINTFCLRILKSLYNARALRDLRAEEASFSMSNSDAGIEDIEVKFRALST